MQHALYCQRKIAVPFGMIIRCTTFGVDSFSLDMQIPD